MRLQLASWPEVETYLQHSRGILIPIGSTEQHGPNGLVGTDALTAEAVAQGIGERVRAYVAPTIAVGMAQHHLGFPGSASLRPTTLIAVLRDIVESLARNGFKRFFFINGHGGNIATVNAAFAEIYAAHSFLPDSGTRVRCTLHNWWEGKKTSSLAAELYGSADGHHATASEVAVTQHIYPDHIKQVTLTPPIAPISDPFSDAEDFRRRYPDGRIGSNPGLATPAHGAQLLQAAIDDLTPVFEAFARS